MLLYIFSALFLVTITQAIDDTPFANFTWQLDRVKGHCVKPHPLIADKKKFEGRWYSPQVSYSEEQVKTLSCYHWDTFFEKDMIHEWCYITENGQQELVVDKEEPVKGRKGVYTNEVNSDPAYNNFFTTLFYANNKFQVRYYVQCFDDGTVSRDAEVGYRKIESANDPTTKQQVKVILKSLKDQVGEFAERYVPHKNCNYEPIMENPYN